jgi:hypothetical protein
MTDYHTDESMNQNLYAFDFKYVYEYTKFTLYFDPNITMKDFIAQVKKQVNNDKIEIIIAGQYINRVAPEDALHIVSSDNTLKTIYGSNWKNISFYIRKGLY